jgi:hypothetical protein
MTFGRASVLAMSLLGAVALGVWIGPHVTKQRAGGGTNVTNTQATQVAEAQPAETNRNVAASPAQPTPKSRTPRRITKQRATPQRATPGVISFSPEVQKRMQPLLNKGADMNIASEGFRSAEQFATVAHAARNTEVPFMILKHRVLDERQTLAVAIHASKPDLNAADEANRARAQAKGDFANAETEAAAALGE